MIRKFRKWAWLSIFAPMVVLAADPGKIIPPNPGNILPGRGTNDTLEGVIVGFIQLFLEIVALIAVAYIMYGGFRYITSSGDPKTAEAAKKTITNAIIGLIIIILSFIIVNVVVNTAILKIK